MCQEERLKHFSFSSGKQSDKKVETSFVCLMQMPDVHVCHRGVAEIKISLPGTPLDSPRAQAFASFFPQALQGGWCGGGGAIAFGGQI